MAATGEECYYQKPIHQYYDNSYDLNFDASIEHYCSRLGKNVVPAKCCGTLCPEFEPLRGIPRTDRSRINDGVTQGEKNARTREHIFRQLHDACDKLRESAKSLARRAERRERKFREVDEWLSQPEVQPDVLARELAASEQDISKALAEQARNQRQLHAKGAGRAKPRDVEFVQEHWAATLKYARQRKQHVEELLGERERREAAYERLYTRWDDGDERLPLLMQLRWEVARCVKATLANEATQLTDPEIDGILRFLRDIPHYGGDDVSIADLKKTVEDLSRRKSLL